jgi:hypothetical protein
MLFVSRPLGLAFGLLVTLTLNARGAGPADGLFRLVPPDAAAVLAIEDLRGRAREFLESPVAQRFERLPAFQAWVASGRLAHLHQAMRKVEHALGEQVDTIRDELLGDAVVLALRVPHNGRPEDASGMILVHVSNRALLDRLIHGINDAQRRSGELTRLAESTRAGASYWSREFRPASRKPTEYFTVLDDNTFAWSNAEDLIQGVIDRRAGQVRSLADIAVFQQVRRRLPEHAVASLFVAPRFLAQVLAAMARPQKPANDRAAAVIGRYLTALDCVGAALQWRDGIVVDTEEVFDPAKLDPWVRHWAARSGEIGPGLRRAPASALAMASVHVDWNAVFDVIRTLAPERQQPRIENLIVALDGILLGRDIQAEILPHLGPGMLAYLEAGDGEREDDTNPRAAAPALAKVIAVGLGNASGLAAAVENALRTYLAFYALDTQHNRGQLQLETRETGGRKVTTLHPTTPLAFAVDADRLVLGSSAAVVSRAITFAANPTEGELDRLRVARFPLASSFACVDLVRLQEFVLNHRARLVARLAPGQGPGRRVEEAEHDLDDATALISLFRHAYLTSAFEPDASAAHRSLGLIPREAEAVP